MNFILLGEKLFAETEDKCIKLREHHTRMRWRICFVVICYSAFSDEDR